MSMLLDKSVVKLAFQNEYVALVKQGILSARGIEKFQEARWRELGGQIQVLIPVKEAGAWIEVMQDHADEARKAGDDDNADKFEYVADIVEEEARKILGTEEVEPVIAENGKRKFWKGV